MLGDSAYGTGDMLDRLKKADRKATIKPWPIRPAVEGGFTIDDFAYDDEAGTLTCPNRVTRTADRDAERGIRHCLQRLPAAGPVHHRRARAAPSGPPPRKAAAAAPATREDPRVPAGLPRQTAPGRTQHRLADPRQPARPLPRGDQEQRLAASPRRRPEPAPTPRSWAHPGPRALAHRLTGTTQTLDPAPSTAHDAPDRHGEPVSHTQGADSPAAQTANPGRPAHHQPDTAAYFSSLLERTGF